MAEHIEKHPYAIYLKKQIQICKQLKQSAKAANNERGYLIHDCKEIAYKNALEKFKEFEKGVAE
jgi:hypothetical protein